jgi:acetate kinase
MGLTPLEGLMMGTRSGDADPSLHLFLQDKEQLTLEEITDLLIRKSDLLGVSGRESRYARCNLSSSNPEPKGTVGD